MSPAAAKRPNLLRVFPVAVKAWWDDKAPRLGAALAYYTLFAIAPILLVAIAIAGSLFGPEAVRGQIVNELDHLIGSEGARAVQELLAGASRRGGGTLATILGSLTFVAAATGAFLELQAALNTIWRVKPKPGGKLKAFLLNRAQSFGLVLAIGFLLMVSLAVSAGLAALSAWIGRSAPGVPLLLDLLNILLSLAVATVLFALLFRILPDVELRWRDVWTGGLVTAVLFTGGKELIGLYLGRSSTASAYGAAGSVVVLLLWVYYASQIVLLGAEFTRVYTRREGEKPPPEPFAKKDPAARPAGS